MQSGKVFSQFRDSLSLAIGELLWCVNLVVTPSFWFEAVVMAIAEDAVRLDLPEVRSRRRHYVGKELLVLRSNGPEYPILQD